MARRFVPGVAAILLACADASCTYGLDEEGTCQEGVSNSLLQTRAKAGSISSLFTLDEGTYVLEDGSCVLNHIHIQSVTYVEKKGEYYSKECMEVCLKITEKAKKDMDDADAQVKTVKESMDKAEAALVAGEEKLYDAQAAENDAKIKFDDTWKVRYSKRTVPKEAWTKKEEERVAQQKIVVDLTKAHYLEEKKYNEWVVARDEKIKIYNEKKAAAALCAKVQFPIGSEGATKQPEAGADSTPAELPGSNPDSLPPAIEEPPAMETIAPKGSTPPALVSTGKHEQSAKA